MDTTEEDADDILNSLKKQDSPRASENNNINPATQNAASNPHSGATNNPRNAPNTMPRNAPPIPYSRPNYSVGSGNVAPTPSPSSAPNSHDHGH